MCGLGSIGQRHARLLAENFGAEVFAVRSGKGTLATPLPGVTELRDLDAAADHSFDAAFVTNPTYLHAETAVACLRAGVRRIFLEKPIDSEPRAVSLLERAAERSKASIYVAYPLRFHPAVAPVREILARRRIFHVRVTCSSWLPDWRPGQDYRRSYSADARKGGGVLLDLSHELDLVHHLTGRRIERIVGVAGRSGALAVRAEDRADLLLALAGGAAANVHIDFMSLQRERRVQIDHAGGFVACDLVEHRVTSIDRATRQREETQLRFAIDDMYIAQLRHFFSAPRRTLATDFAEKVHMTRKLLAFRKTVST